MDILSVISRLLDYPGEDIQASQEAMHSIIADSDLRLELKHKLNQFLEDQLSRDLMEWQAEYDGQFERGRSLALWLFEHVHGESRDRGQAMVDLVKVYREAGLEISQHELPDYIPLFLEFLSTQGKENAQGWLQEVEHILGLLYCRLEKRQSDYAVLLECLLELGDCKVSLDDIRSQIANEKRDDTRKAIDKEWEEEEVTFGAESLDKSCGTASRKPSESQRRDLDIPVNWVGFDANPGQASNTSKSTRVEGM